MPQQKGIVPPPEKSPVTVGKDPKTGKPVFRINGDWNFWFQDLRIAFPKTQTYAIAHNPASIAAGAEATQTLTVSGVTTNDIIVVNKPTKTAGLVLTDAFASAANTVKFTLRNDTGGAIDAGEETYLVLATRR